MKPFSIRLFALSGNPAGIIIASRDDWPGRAVIFPRTLAADVRKRAEYAQPGVYLLVGQKLYIGEGDTVGKRLEEHLKKKDFWHTAVFFTAEGNRLNKAHIQYLEAKLISRAKTAGRIELANATQPAIPQLSEEDHAFLESFMQELLLMLPMLGFWQLTLQAEVTEDLIAAETPKRSANPQPARKAAKAGVPAGLEFVLTARGANARLVTGEQVVTVKAGSRASERVADGFERGSPNYAALRKQLCDEGVMAPTADGLVFMRDKMFASGSAAASVVSGTSSNADGWKGDGGKSLGDYLREMRAKS